jgi:preprotein translocase subunit SecA
MPQLVAPSPAVADAAAAPAASGASLAATASRGVARRAERDPAVLLAPIRELIRHLESLPAVRLKEESLHVRRELACRTAPDALPPLIAGLALAAEALRRERGVALYDVQLLGALAVSRRCIAEMQTGEGKTFVALAAAIQASLAGRGVHVMTPNTYLAGRDSQLAAAVARHLDLNVSLLPERDAGPAKSAAYDADITFGTGAEFGFDYLRDQLTLRAEAGRPLGEGILRQLAGTASTRRMTLQRGLVRAIVDEADSVLIDDAGSPLVLSMKSAGPAADADIHRTAHALAALLQPGTDFELEESLGRVVLTPAGVLRIHATDVAIPVQQLRRPWTDYVTQALRAKLILRRDIHYVVRNDEVRIVDETTGRIFEDRSWQDGLHQAVETAAGVPVTAEHEAVAQITRQRFFRLYEHLSGMTGTASGCESELHSVYGLSVQPIALRVASQRTVLPPRFFSQSASRNAAITADAARLRSEGRAVLIGTSSIADSEQIAGCLRLTGVPCVVLNGLQDAMEADIIAAAGQPGSITIATNMAGRGTDILLHDDVRSRGGLHVIVVGWQSSNRMDRQLIGRCARQGDPGSAQSFVSADDALIRMHGPWLAAALARESTTGGEVFGDFSAALRRIQRAAERHQFSARLSLLNRDNHRDALLRGGRDDR